MKQENVSATVPITDLLTIAYIHLSDRRPSRTAQRRPQARLHIYTTV